jgi:probable HAF family extracellular repeat protein
MLDLGTLGGTLGVANKENNRGQVVGSSDLEGDLRPGDSFLSQNGVLADLGALGGNWEPPTGLMIPEW